MLVEKSHHLNQYCLITTMGCNILYSLHGASHSFQFVYSPIQECRTTISRFSFSKPEMRLPAISLNDQRYDLKK